MTITLRLHIDFTRALMVLSWLLPPRVRMTMPPGPAPSVLPPPRERDALVLEPGRNVVIMSCDCIHCAVTGLDGLTGRPRVDVTLRKRAEEFVGVQHLKAAAGAHDDVQVQVDQLPGALAGPDQRDVDVEVLVPLVTLV